MSGSWLNIYFKIPNNNFNHLNIYPEMLKPEMLPYGNYFILKDEHDNVELFKSLSISYFPNLKYLLYKDNKIILRYK